MKFYHCGLITSLVLIPLAAGHPSCNHGPKAVQDHKIAHRGGLNKPHRNLRQQTQERRAKGEHERKLKEDTTSLPKAGCDTPNPLTKLDSGCPCFDQARIASLIDFSKAQYCDFYQSLGDDTSNQSNYEYTDLYASSPEETLQVEPPIYQTSYVSFAVNKDSDPNYGSTTCYASVDAYKSSISYENFDYDNEFTSWDDSGESHTFYITQSLTDEQYDACLTVLNERKGQLPDNCVIGNDEW